MPVMDPRLTLPLPPRDALEAAVAQAIRIRDFEPALVQFWAREAAKATEPPDYPAMHARWLALREATVSGITAQASVEAARIQALIDAAEPAKQAMAWTVERAKLSDPAAQTRADTDYRTALLGARYEARSSWITELNQAQTRGEALRARWAFWWRHETLARGAPELPREKSIEHEIIRDPDHDGSQEIYADWLQERGVPIGELMALRRAGASARWKAQLLVELGGALGPIEPLVPAIIELAWDEGWFRGATVVWAEPTPERALSMLLAHPAAAALESLTVEPLVRHNRDDEPVSEEAAPFDGLMPALLEAGKRPRVEWLDLNTLGPSLPAPELVRLYPRLRELKLRAHEIEVAPDLTLPHLEAIGLRARNMAAITAALGSWSAPELTSVRLGGSGWATVATTAAHLGRHRGLSFVSLTGLTLGPGALPTLLSAIRSAALKTVRIADAHLDDTSLEELMAAPIVLAGLETLRLSDAEFTRSLVGRFEAAFPDLRFQWDHPDRFHRYAQDGDDDGEEG